MIHFLDRIYPWPNVVVYDAFRRGFLCRLSFASSLRLLVSSLGMHQGLFRREDAPASK